MYLYATKATTHVILQAFSSKAGPDTGVDNGVAVPLELSLLVLNCHAGIDGLPKFVKPGLGVE